MNETQTMLRFKGLDQFVKEVKIKPKPNQKKVLMIYSRDWDYIIIASLGTGLQIGVHWVKGGLVGHFLYPGKYIVADLINKEFIKIRITEDYEMRILKWEGKPPAYLDWLIGGLKPRNDLVQ